MRADGDARAGTCGKLWAALRLKSADFRTFYRFQQLRSTAAEAIFHFSGSPIHLLAHHIGGLADAAGEQFGGLQQRRADLGDGGAAEVLPGRGLKVLPEGGALRQEIDHAAQALQRCQGEGRNELPVCLAGSAPKSQSQTERTIPDGLLLDRCVASATNPYGESDQSSTSRGEEATKIRKRHHCEQS